MCISAKTVFLLSFLIFNIQQLESAKLHIPNEPASSKFKLIGTMTKFGGELAETAGFGISNNGDIKVDTVVNGIAIFLKKLDTPSSVIWLVSKDKVDFYEHVDEKKKENDEKIDKEKPITVTESYKPTTPVYVPAITAKYIAPDYPPYSIPSTTVKYLPPLVTRPYSTKKTAVKYTKQHVPLKTEKPTTTTMMPYMPDVSEYDSIDSVNIPERPEGSLLSDNYYPSPEEDEEDED